VKSDIPCELSPAAQLWCPQNHSVSTGGVIGSLLLPGNQTQNACIAQCWSYSGPGMLSLYLSTWNKHQWCYQHIGVNKPRTNVHNLYSWTLLLCTQLHCTTVHSLVPAWSQFCLLIKEEVWSTCFALKHIVIIK
jgi:hypothetical protein